MHSGKNIVDFSFCFQYDRQFWIPIIFLLLQVIDTNCWPSYRFNIPNGNIVPNPCNPTEMWTAVGHGKPKVFAPRNPFGEDFLRSRMVSKYFKPFNCGFISFRGYPFSWIKDILYFRRYLISVFCQSQHTHQ